MIRGRMDCVPRERGRVMGQLELRSRIGTAGEQRSQPRKQVTADPKSPQRELIGKGGRLTYTDRKKSKWYRCYVMAKRLRRKEINQCGWERSREIFFSNK